jgi:hypothetical protein
MELCTIEDAFPNIGGSTKSGTPFAGGKDGYSSREERRAARKLAKKNKVAAAYSESVKADLPDPDRPAVERMEPIDTVQKEKEAFALPVLPKASCLFSDTGTPNYFGKWTEDDVEETFSSFNPSPKDDANYRLYPDFTKGDVLKGAAKAAGQTLPEPPLNDQWKPITDAASYTAYGKVDASDSEIQARDFKSEQSTQWNILEETKGPVAFNDSAKGNTNDALLKRIDELMGRLDQMEKKQVKDSQTEILMFVGTGLFILVSFELLTRR